MTGKTHNGNAVDAVLWQFCARRVYQPKLSEPKMLGEWIYATNTNAIAIAKKTATLTEYAPHEMDVTVIQPILEREPSTNNRSALISLDELKASYDGIKTSHQRVPDRKCPDCDGEGFTTCMHCDSEVECKSCDGEWMLYVNGAFTVEFEANHAVRIGDAWLQPRYVKWLAESAETLGVETVKHVRAEEREDESKDNEGKVTGTEKYPYYQEFEVGEMRIGIMPIRTRYGCAPDNHELHEISVTLQEVWNQ